MRQALQDLINEWRKAIFDRQHRELSPGNDNIYAAWRGEANAYQIAVRDVELLLDKPQSSRVIALQEVLQTWEREPQKHLGFQTGIEEDFSHKLEYEVIERERAIETLRACAEQFRKLMEQHDVMLSPD